jgi:hypothetical protein
MTDSLERVLLDLHFEVPAGLVERAKAAAALAEPEPLRGGRTLPDTRPQEWTRPPADPRRPMNRRWEWAAGIAAVVIAAIVIGSFVYVRSITRPHEVTPPITSPPPGVPRPSPSLTQPLSVDPSTPVILFGDAGNPNQIDGMTWDGRAGKVTEIAAQGQSVCQVTATTQTCSPPPMGGGAPPLTGALSSTPKGTLFVAIPYFYDRSGHVVATLAGPPYSDYPNVGLYFIGTWADDELHYCQVLPIFGAVPGTLQLTTPGGTPRSVAQIGMQSANENVLTVTSCSVLADRAVVVQVNPSPGPDGNAPHQYWVVQLSNGRVLWTHDLSGSGVARVVASRDGRYVAEVQPDGNTTIIGPSGASVGRVTGAVEAFSWDGTLAVAVSGDGQASVVRWSDGTTIWTVPAGEGMSGFQPEPGGTSFAVHTVNGALYVVSSDGRVIAQRDAPGLLGCLPVRCASSSSANQNQVLPTVLAGNIGWGGGTERTTDGGLHWRDASPPSPTNRTKGGYSDFLLDVNHAWVTEATAPPGEGGASSLAVFATADGGKTWGQSSVPISGAAFTSARLDFIDAQRGWLITDSGLTAFDKATSSLVSQPLTRAVYQTADGGISWTLLTTAHQADGSTLGTLAVGCQVNGLTFTGLNDGWLTMGGNCSIGAGGKQPVSSAPSVGSVVAVTHDGGRTWHAVDLSPLQSGTDYTCVHAPLFTSNRGVIAVDCGRNGQPATSALYATNDAGRSWSSRKLPSASQLLDFVDANNGWTFGGIPLSLYRTTDGGGSWAVVKQFASEQSVSDLSFVDPNVGFALTSRYSPDGRSGYSTMWKTTDGGRSWSVMSTVPTGGRGACC